MLTTLLIGDSAAATGEGGVRLVYPCDVVFRNRNWATSPIHPSDYDIYGGSLRGLLLSLNNVNSIRVVILLGLQYMDSLLVFYFTDNRRTCQFSLSLRFNLHNKTGVSASFY